MSNVRSSVQRLLPQHGMSRLAGSLSRSELPWLKRALIRLFTSLYDVNMSEAARPRLEDYLSFNDFFTRALKPTARPLPGDPLVAVSPADGHISQAGRIEAGRLLQAKGNAYDLDALIGERADHFDGGTFATVYLAPRDYHRVHLPLAGRLHSSRAIPGALFSVNAATEAEIPSLFVRNERLVCRFVTDHGELLVILVGALIVASIETVWGGPSSPYQRIEATTHDGPTFKRGAEIGRFLVGSTVIVCMQPGRAKLASGIRTGASVRMGQPLLSLRPLT